MPGHLLYDLNSGGGPVARRNIYSGENDVQISTGRLPDRCSCAERITKVFQRSANKAE